MLSLLLVKKARCARFWLLALVAKRHARADLQKPLTKAARCRYIVSAPSCLVAIEQALLCP